MQTNLRTALAGLALAALTLAPGTGVASDPSMGTWKLNVAKSKFSPGPAPKSITTTFEPSGKGVKWSGVRVNEDGKSSRAEFTANYDRKDYPVKGSPTADAVALRRINNLTTERVNKKDGNVVSTEIREVAKNGKSYVTTVKGKTASGEPIDHRMVFDRQ